MKTFLCLTMLMIGFGTSAWAQESAGQAAKDARAATQGEKTTKRKKRVLMCKECGKPEPQCECKGEGHGTAGAEAQGGESEGHKH